LKYLMSTKRVPGTNSRQSGTLIYVAWPMSYAPNKNHSFFPQNNRHPWRGSTATFLNHWQQYWRRYWYGRLDVIAVDAVSAVEILGSLDLCWQRLWLRRPGANHAQSDISARVVRSRLVTSHGESVRRRMTSVIEKLNRRRRLERTEKERFLRQREENNA
jgi:hypothetical protein